MDNLSLQRYHFWSFSPSRDVIPLGTLNDCWAKQTFCKFGLFQTPLETGWSITSETDAPSLTGISGATLSTWLGFFWDLPQYMEWTKYPWGQYSLVHQFMSFFAQYMLNWEVFCLPSWMELCKFLSSNTAWNWGETWLLSRFRTRATYLA